MKKIYTLVLFGFIQCFFLLNLNGANIYVAIREPVSAYETVYEDGTSENPYSSIQTAVDVAQKGDVIRIGGGTYQKTQRRTPEGTGQAILIENKTDLTLRPWNDFIEDEVILGPSWYVFPRIPTRASYNIITIINSKRIEIYDLSLISEYGHTSYHHNLVKIENSRNCILSGLQMISPETAVRIDNSEKIQVKSSEIQTPYGVYAINSNRCLFMGNDFDQSTVGINLEGSYNNQIVGNRMSNMIGGTVIAILENSDKNRIVGNTLKNIKYSFGIMIKDSKDNLIYNNDIAKTNSYSPPFYIGSPGNKIIKNSGAENFHQGANYSIIFEGNEVRGNDDYNLNIEYKKSKQSAKR